MHGGRHPDQQHHAYPSMPHSDKRSHLPAGLQLVLAHSPIIFSEGHHLWIPRRSRSLELLAPPTRAADRVPTHMHPSHPPSISPTIPRLHRATQSTQFHGRDIHKWIDLAQRQQMARSYPDPWPSIRKATPLSWSFLIFQDFSVTVRTKHDKTELFG